MFSKGAYHTEIVLLLIADMRRNLSSLAIFISEIVLGMMLRQSRSLLFSMFHSLMFSPEAAKRQSVFFSSSKVRLVMAELSIGVTEMFWNYSRSQYLTVRSDEPLASARFWGLNWMHVTA